jgi:hypothetical protein
MKNSKRRDSILSEGSPDCHKDGAACTFPEETQYSTLGLNVQEERESARHEWSILLIENHVKNRGEVVC